ncbi:DUF4282 domain-containing protein [Nocardiopsis exhalans]|uniref:DUF4282 domain-containing protein n=1 Tax=Nocardiopsis exhalans TaxID=163604 RepID=A0ABY5DGJ7_9ACTN|nr:MULTISPECIES: DUF4282 domain-containing protein [Nocardiopsis]USY22115.1 DUF4282 domain-containing protein [Nocardiopsis exhalans]
MTNPPGYPQDPSQQPYGQQPQSGGYQGGQYQQQPAAGYTQPAPARTGFFGALFDFSFREFITARIIKVVYILWLIMIAIGFLFGLISAIAMMGDDDFGFLGVPMLIGTFVGTAISVLLSRIVLELLIVAFRISEDLNAIRKRGGM